MSYPAGWYPDPWQPGGSRYWDGQAWGPVAPPGPASGPPPFDLAEERRWAGRAVAALWFQAACGLATGIGLALVMHSLRHVFDTIDVQDSSTARFNGGTWVGSLLLQGVGLGSLVASAAVAAWSYRATANTRALGRATTHSPGWAAGSWFVPIVNFWFPYQVVRDLVPPGGDLRARVGLFWGLHLAPSVLVLVVAGVSFVSLAAGVITGVITALVYVAHAVVGSTIVRSITAEHEATAGAEVASA